MIFELLNTLFNIYYWMIIAYILMSWLPNARESFIGEMLGKFVEPYLSPFRRFIPPLFGTLDISPIVALFTLTLVRAGLFTILGYLF